MDSVKPTPIYTIGHSTHPIQAFLKMLQSFGIKNLVDVRKLPGSRKFPQYNQDALREYLKEIGINYRYETN